MREMFSSISVPPRSLTPQRRLSVAASRPIFTQLAWRFVIVRPRARRKAAVCLRFSSREISSIPWVRPSSVWKGMNESGTNSVIPPVRSWSSRIDPHVAGQLPGLLDVAEHHRRGRAQARAVAGLDDLHPARGRELVGRDPRADAVVEHLRRGPRGRAEPALAQVVEHLARATAARALAHVVDLHRRVRVQVELRRGLLREPQPARRSPRACTRGGCRPACRSRWRRSRPPRRSAPGSRRASTWYASGERLPWPKPQNAQPTMQMLVKLMLRLTTNVAMSPASSARSSSAATRISSITSGRRLGEERRRARPR